MFQEIILDLLSNKGSLEKDIRWRYIIELQMNTYMIVIDEAISSNKYEGYIYQME